VTIIKVEKRILRPDVRKEAEEAATDVVREFRAAYDRFENTLDGYLSKTHRRCLELFEELPGWAAEVPPAAAVLAEACWPGPLTLLLPRGPRVSDAVTGGRPTVGLRVPAHPLTLELLRRAGRGIAAPSANRFGRVSPTTAAHVLADLGPYLPLLG